MRTPLEDRFWPKVVVSDDMGLCWLWTGSVDGNGYGKIAAGGDGGKLLRAHRVAYEFLRGEILSGHVLDHLCRVPDCVNPWHLEAVTQRENVKRGRGPEVTRARWAAQTHCKNGHERNPENTWTNGVRRACRVCIRENAARYRGERRRGVI